MSDRTTSTVDTHLAMWSVWADGYHSLCAQRPGGEFRTVGFFDKPLDMLEYAAAHPQENLWWGINGIANPPARGRGTNDDVTAVTALFADVDWANDEAHKGTDLPSEDDVRAMVARLEPHPTMIVESGNGLHLYWALTTPLDGEAGQELADGFNRFLEAEYGLKNDRIDAASVLRVPGSMNHKTDPARLVTVAHYEDDVGIDVGWLRENAWLDVPATVVAPAPSHGLSVAALDVPHRGTEESPIEWVKNNFDSYQALLRLGWQPGHRKGDEEQMTRPGKSARDGTSATFHHDTGAVNIYTTSLPQEYLNLGTSGRGCITLTTFDMWCVENGFHSPSTASKAIRQMMGQTQRPAPSGVVDEGKPSVEGPDAGTVEGSTCSAPLTLPDEFWEMRNDMAHIRQAAWSRMTSPSGVLGAVIARYANAIPPEVVIPPIVGATATFDHLSVLVGESSGGKSVCMSVARDLYRGPQYKSLIWDLPVPTGEGLVHSFFEEVTEDENGKKKIVLKKTKNGVHFSIDEGMALVSAGNRQGNTIASVLCAAWSGQNPGQANASKERRRIDLHPHTFRMAEIMGIQASLGHHLLADTWVQQGLAGRLVFFATEDPTIPFEQPAWPGPLELPTQSTVSLEISFESSIVDEIRLAHWQKVTKQVVESPIDGHLRLVRLKLAGIFALMDNRTHVTDHDWEMAGIVVASSVSLRTRMFTLAEEQRQRENVTRATASGHSELVAHDVKERAFRERASGAILRALTRHPEGRTYDQLRSTMDRGPVRDHFPGALEALQDAQKIVSTEGGQKKIYTLK